MVSAERIDAVGAGIIGMLKLTFASQASLSVMVALVGPGVSINCVKLPDGPLVKGIVPVPNQPSFINIEKLFT